MVKIIEQRTHLKINNELCGEPIEIEDEYSKVKLELTSNMVLDDTGLIHGGFTFSLADYAAMLAINHPNVVLGGANIKFLKPVKKGDTLIAEAKLIKIEGKKHIVNVDVKHRKETIFTGEFFCFITEKHVLKGVDSL